MATYVELFDLRADSVLRNKVAVAVVVKAEDLLTLATPTVNQVAWASEALTNPLTKAGQLLGFVLAANKDLTVAQITGASDAAIQSNVNTAADAIIAGAA